MKKAEKVRYVLGIHFGHDSSCSLVKDGKVIASVAEERFTQSKHYSLPPIRALSYCLKSAGITMKDVDLVVFPSIARLMELEVLLNLQKQPWVPKGDSGIAKDLSYYIRYFLIEKRRLIRKKLVELPTYVKRYDASGKEVLHIEHHLAHAASCYYTSGFNEKALVITADGSGDGLSTTVWVGEKGRLSPLLKVGREGSLGAFYGTVTEALGWIVSDGEGKTMGLAPYGNTKKTRGKLSFICPHYEKGRLVKPYNWGWPAEWKDESADHWHFSAADRVKELAEKYGNENIAAEAQRLLERELLAFVKYWKDKTGLKRVAVSGGVFLNVKANQRILESKIFDEFFAFPDAGDSGVSAGAALYGYYLKNPGAKIERLTNTYWGPLYTNEEIEKVLKVRKLKYKRLPTRQIPKEAAKLLARGKIVGWFQGRMEAGPRALGSRSILMDPRKAENKDIINATVKYREAFRPFCPSILEEAAYEYFEDAEKAPFMIISFDVKKGYEKNIPAVTHVDGTARPQTVNKKQNPLYYGLIKEFGRITGVPVLLNTSFNIKGKPIVCSPEDAIKCFYDTGIEYMFLGNFVLRK